MDQRRAAAALLALAACIACSAAAPTAGDHTALELHSGHVEGCYYNFQHYGEGDRIMTNEPCLNCTCHNRMLMCYLRVCPFTKAIGQDCTVEKRADQCCPIVTCPDVPVDLLTSTSTSSPAEYGSTGVGKLDKYGCSIHGKYFPEGSKVPPTPNKPCEHCYCIRNMTTCVMQECTLHVDGCTPIYHKDVCCPVRYSCDHPEDEIPLLDDMTTTVRPTPGFLLTTTTMLPVTQMSQNCIHDDHVFPDGALIKTEKACEHCYCMKGDIVCVVQECGTPMENEGKNCTSLAPRQGQCCPDTYICEGDGRFTESATDIIELTSPPRRVGVEGSGYRNEPDGPYTETNVLTTEFEGSGEDFETGPPISTLENTPDKGSVPSEIVDETSLAPTESNLQYGYSTDTVKEQNTIPDSISDKETTQKPLPHKVTLSHSIESTTDDQNAEVVTSQKDEFAPTESAFREEDEVVSTDTAFKKESEIVSTESTVIKDIEKVPDEVATKIVPEEATTLSSDLLDMSTSFKDEHKEFTSPEDQEIISSLLGSTGKAQKPSQPEKTTPIIDDSSRTEKNRVTDDLFALTNTEIYDRSTISNIKVIDVETTTLNPNINEVDDNILPPSRIPGEGDCLLNGITYSNNTSIPSTSNCHTGCKCISSIIKCDPIICSPPPDYMENMNDCQPIYDTPESCCPTYVCSVKETIPPQSHSQMSGTESPKPVASECSGNDCLISEEKHPTPETTTNCTSNECLEETLIVKDECESKDCKDQLQETPAKPSQDCVDGICQVSSIIPCEGEKCKIEPTKNAIPQKDLDSSAHEIPSHTCDEQSGCVEQQVTGLEECNDKNCRRKDQEGIQQEPSSPDCAGLECELQDKSTLPSLVEKVTVRSTEKIFTEISTENTFGETDKKETDSIDSDVTTATEKVELDIEVTKSPLKYTESLEKLSSIFGQTITDIPKQYDDSKEFLETDIPKLDTVTLLPETVMTTMEPFLTESPKVTFSEIGEHKNILTETTQTQKTFSQTENERLTTEKAESTKYIETKTEESFTPSIVKLSTENSQVFTDSDGLHKTESDDMYTKLPPHVTESENAVPESVGTEKYDKQTDIVEEEKTQTISPENNEILTTYSVTSKEMFTYIETSQPTLSGVMVTDKVAIESETESSLTEKEQAETSAPAEVITEKTEVTKSIPERGDIQTEPLNKSTKDQEEENQSEIPRFTDKHKLETETTVSPTMVKEPFSTIVPDLFVTEKKESPVATITKKDDIQPIVTVTEKVDVLTESPFTTEIFLTKAQEPMFTETHSIGTETSSEIISTKEEIQTDIPNITLDPTVIKTVSPHQHELKIETTTAQKYDSSLVEEQTIESITHKIDEIEYPQVTEETTIKQHTKSTEKIEIYDKENKIFDDLHKPEQITPDDANRKDTTTDDLETYTPHYTFSNTNDMFGVTGLHDSKTETIPLDTYKEVTESIYYTPEIEELDETTKVVAQQEVIKEEETFTKPSYDIVTKSEKEGVATSGIEKTYTTSPMIDATKPVEISKTVDNSITDSQTKKAPEIVESQFTETSTQYSESLTEKHIETAADVTESVSLSTHEVSEIQDKATTITQISSKKLPELQSTMAEDKSMTEKSTEKYYSLTTSESDTTESEKQFDIEKQTIPSEHTTLRNTEEVTPEIDTKPLQEQIPTDQKLDLEYPHIVTSVQEDNKIHETSTGALDIITKDTESYSGIPVFIEEQHELTSKTPGEEATMVTKYKEPISDNLTTQSTHKDELSVDQAATISHEITKLANEITESYVETTINPLVEIEKQKTSEIEQSTKSQPTESSHISEVESASLVTAIQPEIIDSTGTIGLEYTVRGEDEDLSSSTETVKEVSKLDEKLYITETHDLKEDNLPKETSSTQTLSQISEEISTESLSFPIDDADKNLQDFNERSTKVPDTTLFDLSSVEDKDKEATTQSIISFTNITTTQPTISEAIHKVATTVMDEKDIQLQQDLINETLLTTASSSEDSRKTTDVPMLLNTGIYEEKLPEITKSEKDVNIMETTSKTPTEQELEENEKHTHMYVTESPEYHVTSKELGIESSTEINISFATLVPQYGEKTPTPTEKDKEVIPISVEQTNIDITTAATESNIDMQKEVSPGILNTGEELHDTQQQKTTPELIPTFEKQDEISYEQTTLTEPVDKMPTKYPHEAYTVIDEITTVPSKLLEMEHDKETVSTEGFPTDQNEEEPINTIMPETETSKTELIDETTDIPRVPASTIISMPIANEITEKPVPVVTEIIEPDVIEKDLVSTEIIQSQEETTMHKYLEISSEKETVTTEHTPPSESTEEQFTVAEQQENITEGFVGSKVTDIKLTSTQSSPSVLSEEHYAVTENLGQEKTDHLSVTQHPGDSSISENPTDSAVKDKFTTVSPAAEEEVPGVTFKETEIKPQVYSTEPTIIKEKLTTEPAAEAETSKPFVTLGETEIEPEIYSTQSTIVKEKITTESSAEEKTPISIVTLKETYAQPEIYSTQPTIVKEVFSTQSAAEQDTSKPEVTLKETEIQPEKYSTQATVVKQEITTEPTAEEKTSIAIATLKEFDSQSEIYSTQPSIVTEAFTTESVAEKETSKPVVTLKEIEIETEKYNTQSTIIKEEITIEPSAEKMTPKPIVPLKETDIQLEIDTTQPTLVKESLPTISSGELSKETETTETSTLVHVPTEVISATLGSSISKEDAAQTHNESDLSDDTKAITEPTHEFSETTPFLIELTEHAHEVIDDSSRTTAEELTTVHYIPQQPEGIQELDVTKQYEDKYQTLSPITEIEHAYKDKEQFSTHIDGAIDQNIVTTAGLSSETSSSTEIMSSTYSELSLHEQENKSTIVHDVSVTTSRSSTMASEKDVFTTTTSDKQKVTYSVPETPLISNEKDIHVGETEKPSETNIETTLSEEVLEPGTPKATTIKVNEETSTYFPKLEEKPTITTLSPLQEAMKPSIDDEINENLPSPDFPPSGGYGQEPDYSEEDQAFGPGTCRYGGKVYVSAQQIPRDDPCDFCFCFRSDIICLQQSCPPPIHGCHEEPIQGFCCPRYECPVSMATTVNVTTTTTTTTTTLPPHFLPHAYKGAAQRRGCQIKGHTYKVGEVVRASSGPCLQCSCGGDGQMKCDPKVCTPEPMLRQMIAAAVSAKRRR